MGKPETERIPSQLPGGQPSTDIMIRIECSADACLCGLAVVAEDSSFIPCGRHQQNILGECLLPDRRPGLGPEFCQRRSAPEQLAAHGVPESSYLSACSAGSVGPPRPRQLDPAIACWITKALDLGYGCN